MRVLILSAGVISSFNAARLTQAGQDVTLLARGRRREDQREHGVVLEDFRTRQCTTTHVPLIDRSTTDGPAQQDGGTQLNVTPDFSETGFAFKLSCGSKRKRLSGISALFLPLKRNTAPKAVPH